MNAPLSRRVERASIRLMFCTNALRFLCCDLVPCRQRALVPLSLMAIRFVWLGAALFGLQGCQLLGGARIDQIALGSGKPSNVAAFVSVTHKGKPVAGLPASAFEVSENDQPINADTSQVQLLDVTRYATFHTVLLVDISQANQAPARKLLAKAAGAFVRRARLGQSVTVVAFDGGDKVRLVADYSLDAHASAPEQVDALLPMAPVDPSRNLRGAVAQGLELLNRRLGANGNAVTLGTLAVFTRGPDLAGRYPRDQLNDVLSSNKSKLVLIDVTGDTQDEVASQVSESGVIHAQSAETLPIAFEDTASLVDGLREQYYLISYCSPSRAGTRSLSVTVSVPVAEGKDEKASFGAQFDAKGFSAGCDPQKVPTLVLKSQAIKPKGTAPSGSPSSGRVGAGTAPSSSGANGKASQAEEDEAPVPSKPGYAQ